MSQAAAWPYANEVDHAGPWTEQDYFAMPEDGRRVELLDGALLVNPPPGAPHQRLSRNLTWRLATAAPAGLELLEGVGVRLMTGRILIPDIAVVIRPGVDVAVCDPDDVAMIVEITSPGSGAADRAIRPRLYAQAGIAHYLHVVPGRSGPTATAFALDDGTYTTTARSAPGEAFELVEPFPVVLDVAELARAVRPTQP